MSDSVYARLDVSPAVVAALTGLPEVDTWQAVTLLLTATPEGVVDVCLLSKAEIAAHAHGLYIVVASRKARANIGETDRATVVVFTEDGSVCYLAMTRRLQVEHADVTGYAFSVARVLGDDVGVPLQPMRYRVEPHLVQSENWTRSAQVLAEVSAADGPTR